MKKYRLFENPPRYLAFLFLVLSILWMVFLSSCGMIFPSLSGGTLRINLTSDSGPRTISSNLNLAVVAWKIEGSGPGGDSFSVGEVREQSYTKTGLGPGYWDITATGMNSSGIPIVRGTCEVQILEARTVYVALTCTMIDGKGTLDLTISWPASDIRIPEVRGWIQPIGGEARNIVFTTGTGTARCTVGDLDTGYYWVGIELRDSYGTGKQVWSAVEAAHIIDGQTSAGNWNITSADMRALRNGDVNVNVHAFAEYPLAVGISGGRPRLATGESATFQASARPGAEQWLWFLDGFPIVGETSPTLTIDASLAEGNHVVTAAARKGEKAGTAEYWFRKTSYSSVRFLAFGSGFNFYGQLGIGTRTSQLSPTATTGLGTHSVEMIAAGANHTIAVTKTGTWAAWGDNFMAQLGDGTVDERLSPVLVRDPPSGRVRKIAAGSYHSMVLLEDGTLWGWGANNFGQLGIGWAAEQAMPVKVKGLGTRFIVDFALGGDHSLALDSEGILWAWGQNSDGQIGDGTTVGRDMPCRVMGLDGRNVVSIAAGYASSAAVLSDGSVFAWGDNSKGQLGDGTTTDRKFPVLATSLGDKKIQALSLGGCGLGGGHGLALSTEGSLWSWGDNSYGQLGIGSTVSSLTPAAISLPAGKKVKKIASGGFHSLALMTDGSVWGWGRGNNGQLGTGLSANKTSPTQMSTPQGSVIVDISCGELFSYLLKSEEVL